jgi:hypothetical protein
MPPKRCGIETLFSFADGWSVSARARSRPRRDGIGPDNQGVGELATSDAGVPESSVSYVIGRGV